MGKTEDKIKDLQTQTIKELIDTEKSYFNGLITFQEVYIKPLMKCNPSLPKSEYEKLKIFLTRIQAIIIISNELQKHPAFYKENPSPQDIAECFIKHHKLFELLKEYIQEYSTIFHLALSNSKFNKTCNKLLKKPGAHNKSISDYAITPIQRITRYSLLLKELLKHLPQETSIQQEEYKSVTKALLSIESVIRNVNQRDLSESPEFLCAISKIPIKKNEITSPNTTRTFCKKYEQQAKDYEKVSGKKLQGQPEEEQLITHLWNEAKQKPKPTIIPNPNFNTPTPNKEPSVQSPPKSLINTPYTLKSNLRKIYKYISANRICEPCNRATLKVKITPQLEYYIKQDDNESKKLNYEAALSNNDADNKKIIIAACQDAADAAIESGNKMVFDVSNSSMPDSIKILMYKTFKAKLKTAQSEGQEPPFTILPLSCEKLHSKTKKKKH